MPFARVEELTGCPLPPEAASMSWWPESFGGASGEPADWRVEIGVGEDGALCPRDLTGAVGARGYREARRSNVSGYFCAIRMRAAAESEGLHGSRGGCRRRRMVERPGNPAHRLHFLAQRLACHPREAECRANQRDGADQ